MIRRTPYTTLLFLLFAFFLQQHNVHAKEKQTVPEVVIHADKIRYSNSDETITATGNVVIERENTRITGDYARLENKKNIGTIEGRVTVNDPENSMKSSKAILNIKTGLGTFYDASGTMAPTYHFTGMIVEKLTEDRYRILDGSFTTCCETPAPWKIEAKKLDLYLEHYAYISHSSFRIMDIPVFYFPYFVFPVKTKRQTGLLPPLIGGSGKEGIMVTNTFFWAINKSQDATLTWQHKELRGEKFGLEYRYMLSKESYGNFNSSYTLDYEPVDQTRSLLWKINYDHIQKLPYGTSGSIHIDQVSETNPDRKFDFENIEASTKNYTDSYINISKNWSSRSLQFNMRRRVTTGTKDAGRFDEIPALTFSNTSEQIGTTPLYFNMESSYKSFKSIKDGSPDISVSRVDALPTLSMPLALAPWFSITPSGSYRETWYSNGSQSKSFFRGFYEGGFSAAGPKLFRIFNFRAAALKHMIEPGFSYSHTSAIDSSIREQIIEFDDIDKSGRVGEPADSISYSVSNILLKKTPLAAISEIARLDLSQSFDIQEYRRNTGTTPKRPFGDISVVLQTRLHPKVKFDYYNTFDIYNKTVLAETIDIDINFPEKWYFTLERRKKRERRGASPSSITDIATIGLNLKNKLKVEAGIHYDELGSIRKESDYAMTYSAGCWELSFDVINRQITENAKIRYETKFFFSIVLKDLITYGEKGPLGFVKRRF